jgi:hypothetical protein
VEIKHEEVKDQNAKCKIEDVIAAERQFRNFDI